MSEKKKLNYEGEMALFPFVVKGSMEIFFGKPICFHIGKHCDGGKDIPDHAHFWVCISGHRLRKTVHAFVKDMPSLRLWSMWSDG